MNRFFMYLMAFSFVALTGCKHVDLRTKDFKKTGLEEAQMAKGKALLESAWQAQGMDNMVNHTTYAVQAEDHWKGLMGRMGKVWPEARSALSLKYAINTFDSQVTFLDGKEEGLTAGLQSWQYYEQEKGAAIDFKDKPNPKIRFGLSAFHYFFEFADRLKKAPIITAMDEKERDGVVYDRVFITWENLKAHGEHDQYIVWISKNSGLIEYAEFTVRDTFLKVPGYKAFYGSIHFDDFREINGVLIPFEQYIFLNKPKKDTKYLHKLTISDFAFDTFDVAELRPNPELSKMGDEKVTP